MSIWNCFCSVLAFIIQQNVAQYGTMWSADSAQFSMVSMVYNICTRKSLMATIWCNLVMSPPTFTAALSVCTNVFLDYHPNEWIQGNLRKTLCCWTMTLCTQFPAPLLICLLIHQIAHHIMPLPLIFLLNSELICPMHCKRHVPPSPDIDSKPFEKQDILLIWAHRTCMFHFVKGQQKKNCLTLFFIYFVPPTVRKMWGCGWRNKFKLTSLH